MNSGLLPKLGPRAGVTYSHRSHIESLERKAGGRARLTEYKAAFSAVVAPDRGAKGGGTLCTRRRV